MVHSGGKIPDRIQAAGVCSSLLVLTLTSMNRRYRLRRSCNFARVRRAGHSWPHRLVVLAVAPNGLAVSRFGFVVSKRMGGAVRRNRVRRLLREAVRRNMDSIPEGWDCVIIARVPVAAASFSQIQAALIELLRRASLWQTPEETSRPEAPAPGGVGLRDQVLYA